MAGKRGPESFEKRQRERNKQQKQTLKDARRREKSARKKDAGQGGDGSTESRLRALPLGIIHTRTSPNTFLTPLEPRTPQPRTPQARPPQAF